jgi:hypothetical protein
MGIFQAISDWVSFRVMITPIILKVVFQILFWLLNILGILGLLAYLVLGLLGALAMLTQDAGSAIISAIIVIVMFFVFVLLLVLYNLFLRVYFEIILLLFNMYDSLKNTERLLEGNGKKAAAK